MNVHSKLYSLQDKRSPKHNPCHLFHENCFQQFLAVVQARFRLSVMSSGVQKSVYLPGFYAQSNITAWFLFCLYGVTVAIWNKVRYFWFAKNLSDSCMTRRKVLKFNIFIESTSQLCGPHKSFLHEKSEVRNVQA